jgi:flagellar basal body-associated protein FliL
VNDAGGFKDVKVWILLALGVAAVVLLALNVSLSGANRARLAEVTERQAFINDTIRLSSFSTQFIQSLATLAANTGDQAIRDVLAKHGVTFEVQPPAASEATADESKP